MNEVNANSVLNAPKIGSSNQLGSFNEMTIRFTAASNAAANATIYPVPGAGSAAAAALPANVTYTGDFSTYADLVDYLKANKLHIRYIRIQTDNTANFSGRIEFGERKPNLVSNTVQPMSLSQFRESTGNGYSDVLRLTETDLKGGKTIWGAFYLKGNVLASSYVEYTLGISHWEKETELEAIG